MMGRLLVFQALHEGSIIESCEGKNGLNLPAFV
jgi:hypothetical protein